MLRGIGPGNPNMSGPKFKAVFEELGFTKVQVVLASGNILFATPERDKDVLAARVETALPQRLGFTRSVIIRSQQDLQDLIDQDPFHDLEVNHNKGMYLLITFFKRRPHLPFALPYTPAGKSYTLLGYRDSTLYGLVDLTHSKTPDYMAWLEKQFGKDITSRTPRTVRLILSRMNKT